MPGSSSHNHLQHYGCHVDVNGKDRVGRQGLYAIKSRLYNSGWRREEIQRAKEMTQEVQQGTQRFVELWGEVSWVGNMSAMRAGF